MISGGLYLNRVGLYQFMVYKLYAPHDDDDDDAWAILIILFNYCYTSMFSGRSH